jgi:hypothetical protein
MVPTSTLSPLAALVERVSGFFNQLAPGSDATGKTATKAAASGSSAAAGGKSRQQAVRRQPAAADDMTQTAADAAAAGALANAIKMAAAPTGGSTGKPAPGHRHGGGGHRDGQAPTKLTHDDDASSLASSQPRVGTRRLSQASAMAAIAAGGEGSSTMTTGIAGPGADGGVGSRKRRAGE